MFRTSGLTCLSAGTQLPGPGTIVTSLNVKFTAPVFVGEEVEAEVEATEVRGRRAVFSIACRKTSDREVAIKGEAHLMLPNDVETDDESDS